MKKIRLILTSLLLIVTVYAYGQNVSVSGVVTDASTGERIPYATVVVKGTTTGTATDDAGNYSLIAPANATLTFSFVGYVEQDVEINGRAVINVKMTTDSEYLEDVVVVAYGTTTRKSFTGSATVVSSDVIEKATATTITSALAGTVAGVQLTSANGAPGASPTIRIRGFSSISAGNDPLIIVDGAPYSGDLTNLSQSDIESMTVLKDAASTALYGARGANGVIMITTKRAKSGEALVVLDAKVGINNRALKRYNTINNPAEYYEAHFQSMVNYYVAELGYSYNDAVLKANANMGGMASDGGLGYVVYTVPENQLLIGTNGKLNPGATLGRVVGDYYLTPDDWEAEAYRQGIRQEYTFTVSGASDKTNFYTSLSYLSNEGITKASDMSRLTARLRADYQAKKWMKVGGNMSYSNFNHNSLNNNGDSNSTGNIWAFTSQMAPIYPLWIRNADQSIMVDANGFQMMDYGEGSNAGCSRPFLTNANALMDSYLNTVNAEGNAVTANGYVDLNLFKGLKLTINGAMNLDETRATYVYNPYYGQFAGTKGTVVKDHTRYLDTDFQQLLNYEFNAGENQIKAMIGHDYYKNMAYGLGATKSNMFSQKNKELSGAVVDGQGAYSSKSMYNNEAYFGRVEANIADRYIAEAQYRREASSRFDPQYRWGNFWAASAAWLVNYEDWFTMEDVDMLKLKVSYGQQGNDNIGSYRYTDLYTIANSSGNVSTMFSTKGSATISWETINSFNIGAEFDMMKGKISGSLEYFNRLTTNMLFNFPVAPSMGYSSYFANVGDMKNYGLELELKVNLVNTPNINWDVNLNATYLKNRITMIHDDKKTITAHDAAGNEYYGYQSGDHFIAEDVSLFTWYLKEFAGVDQENGKSLWYKDELDEAGEKTGNRVTTSEWAEATYYVNGTTSISPLYGGFGTSLEAYGFDFSVNFTYQLGGLQYDDGYANAMASPTSSSTGDTFHYDILKSWTAANPSNEIPRFQFQDIYSAGRSTRFLTDASYLNFQNLNIGYSLPSSVSKKLGATLRIFASAENVWYWSKRQGFDPRLSYSGAGAGNYSPMRTISGGITVKF